MPLNKYLAHAGICSRRQAVELIKSGKVTVNNSTEYEPGYKVMPHDVVMVNGSVVRTQDKAYVLMNKPKGYITTVSDERGRKTVMDLIGSSGLHVRVYPVGRLDRDTTGLLLLTNDGELAEKLSHPRYQVQKVYHVTLNKVVSTGAMRAMVEGLTLEDGEIHVDSVTYIPDNPRSRVKVTLHSGKNRIVRRIFEHLGYEVEKLERVQYASLTTRGLQRGAWRYLTRHEIALLQR